MSQGSLTHNQLQDTKVTLNSKEQPQLLSSFMDSIVDDILDDMFSYPGDAKLHNPPELQTYGNLHQVRVHTQFSDNLCGFHALFNSACFLSFLITQTNDYISTVTSSAKFWHYYNVFKDFLLREYPEKNEIKRINNMGPLDRPHLEFAIQHKQFPLLCDIQETSSKHGNSLFFTVFYYNFGIVQMSPEQIQELNHQIDLFKSSDSPKAITFYAGPNSHWLVLIAYQKRKDKEIQFYMMDPSNLPLNYLLDENIPALLEVIKQRKEERGEDTNSITREESNPESIAWSLKDRKNAIILLQDLVLDKKRIEVVLVENEFKELFRTFEEYLPSWRQQFQGEEYQLQKQSENTCIEEDKILSNVWVFMKEEYRPQVVENDMAKPLRLYSQFIKQYFDKNLAKDVVNLMKGVILSATDKLQQQISNRVKPTSENEDEIARDIDILVKWNTVSSEIIKILQEIL